MSNLKRHFNFTKPQTLSDNSASQISPPQFDKHNFMNNICSCLDICCSYIQALNSLCGAGSLLARNLLQTVQNVPAYHDVAQQFFCVWDEVGKATAGASAAVKTETLMMLQEVLNTLETSDHSGNTSNLDSFQVIGSCLFSFIELQAQFSMSTWKSLSKLSKNFSNDAFMHSLHWKSHDRHTLKASKNSELSSTIKKHFSHLVHKYEGQKVCDPVEIPQSQFYLTPVILSSSTSSKNISETAHSSPVWSPSSPIWSSPTKSEQTVLESSPIKHYNPAPIQKPSPIASPDLEEVINLLSCAPVDQIPTEKNRLSPNQSAIESASQSYQFWPQGSGPVLSRHMSRPWSEGNRNINFGYDSWIWRTDNMNCVALPTKDFEGTSNKHKRSWDNLDYNSSRWSFRGCENGSSSDDASSNTGQDIDSFSLGATSLHNQSLLGSVQQRRYSSSDGLPDAQENVPDAYLWNHYSQKTSTWPLKQLNSRFVASLDWFERSAESKCMPLFYTPPPS